MSTGERYLNWVVALCGWFWTDLLGAGVRAVEGAFGLDPLGPVSATTLRVALMLVPLFVALEGWARLRNAVHEWRVRRSMAGFEVPPEEGNDEFGDTLEAAKHPKHTMEELRRQKRYGRMAEVYASLNQPEEAARWYLKDGQQLRAAEELAKAGRTDQAAKLMWKSGEYATAARFFAATGKSARAAAAYEKAQMPGEAAEAWLAAGKPARALDFLDRWMQADAAGTPEGERAADTAYRLLQNATGMSGPEAGRRRALLAEAGRRFRAAGRGALAARVLEEAGAFAEAAELFARLGNEAEARRCLGRAKGGS
jgi:tetratricopeptide (TPR) repeat protein